MSGLACSVGFVRFGAKIRKTGASIEGEGVGFESERVEKKLNLLEVEEIEMSGEVAFDLFNDL